MILTKLKKGIFMFGCICVFTASALPTVTKASILEQVQPYSEYSGDCGLLLTVNKNEANVSAYIYGKPNTSRVSVKATLQKKTENGWVDKKTWKTEKNGNYAEISGTYTISKGTYRVHATFKADSETKTMLSGTKAY